MDLPIHSIRKPDPFVQAAQEPPSMSAQKVGLADVTSAGHCAYGVL
jgi:hypothetical protein